MKAIVGLLTLDDHAGASATQREACRTVQLLATRADNVYRLLGAGLIVSLSMLARTENLIKKQFASTMLLRVASEAGCRRSLLDGGGARTLCFLCRPSLPRKVVIATDDLPCMQVLTTAPPPVTPTEGRTAGGERDHSNVHFGRLRAVAARHGRRLGACDPCELVRPGDAPRRLPGSLMATDDLPCMRALATAPPLVAPSDGALMATDDLPCMQVLTTARPTRSAARRSPTCSRAWRRRRRRRRWPRQ